MKKLIFIFSLFAIVSCADEDPIEPDTDPRDKFLGQWNVLEEEQGVGSLNYIATVVNDSGNTSRIQINNIYNLGSAVSVKALVADNSLSISAQDADGITISGSGTFSTNSFILNYTADEGDQVHAIKATYTR
jgi:hypothetical protein